MLDTLVNDELHFHTNRNLLSSQSNQCKRKHRITQVANWFVMLKKDDILLYEISNFCGSLFTRYAFKYLWIFLVRWINR